MTKLNKSDLIRSIALVTGQLQSDTEATINALLAHIRTHVAAEDEVHLIGFGTFKPHHRAAGIATHPRTGERIDVPASTRIGFKPAKLKQQA